MTFVSFRQGGKTVWNREHKVVYRLQGYIASMEKGGISQPQKRLGKGHPVKNIREHEQEEDT